jgi:hypothetical protein
MAIAGFSSCFWRPRCAANETWASRR